MREPDKTCWFCGTRPGEPSAVLEVAMHKNVRRVRTFFDREKVKWDTAFVEVPRCAECKSIHRRSDKIGMPGGMASVLISSAVCLFFGISKDNWVWGMILAAITFIISIAFIALLFRILIPEEADVKRESEKYGYPHAKEMEKKGWKRGASPGIREYWFS